MDNLSKSDIQEIIELYADKYDLPDYEVWYKSYKSCTGRFSVYFSKFLSNKPLRIVLKFSQMLMNDSSISIEVKYAVVLHELTHFIQFIKVGHTNHDEDFKNIETMLFNDFGLRPVNYKKAYWTSVGATTSNRNFGTI